MDTKKSLLLILLITAGGIILFFPGLSGISRKENTESIKLPQNGKPIFLDFWSPTCYMCKLMSPSIGKLESEFKNNFNFLSINVANPSSYKLSAQFKVFGVPTMYILYPDGSVYKVFSGVVPLRNLREECNLLINKLKISASRDRSHTCLYIKTKFHGKSS